MPGWGTNQPLPFVVLQGEPQLLDGSVTRGERGNAMTTEVVTRVLHGILGVLECCDRFPYFRMGLSAVACSRGLWASCLLRDGRNL